MHKSIAVLAGAAGGAFGYFEPAGRIAIFHHDHAALDCRHWPFEGQDLSDPRAALACLEVFAFGGRAGSNQAVHFPDADVQDSNYRDGAVLETGLFRDSRHIGEVGNRSGKLSREPRRHSRGRAGARPFGGANWQPFRGRRLAKLVAQSVPLIGAAGGRGHQLCLRRSFSDDRACHFTVLRLERRYGVHIVRAEYERMRKST